MKLTRNLKSISNENDKIVRMFNDESLVTSGEGRVSQRVDQPGVSAR